LLPYVDSRVIVTMLDIGQGDAIVIELPYRRAVIFIDAGATVSFDSNEPSDRVYRQIIRPFLRGRSIDAIDMVFVSHEHLDHIGSLTFLKEEYAINHMYTSLFYVDDLFDHEKDPLFTALPAGSY